MAAPKSNTIFEKQLKTHLIIDGKYKKFITDVNRYIKNKTRHVDPAYLDLLITELYSELDKLSEYEQLVNHHKHTHSSNIRHARQRRHGFVPGQDDDDRNYIIDDGKERDQFEKLHSKYNNKNF